MKRERLRNWKNDIILIHSPIKTDGFISFTTSNNDFITLYFFAYQILWPSRLPSGRSLTSSPSISIIQILSRACCVLQPSTSIAFTQRLAIPIAAWIERQNEFQRQWYGNEGGGVGKIVTYDTSPAPKNTNLFSDILFLVILFDARIPATATAAVPCISSLNVQYLSRYLSKKRKALWLPKSSNCKTRLHTHTWCSKYSKYRDILYSKIYCTTKWESRIEWIEENVEWRNVLGWEHFDHTFSRKRP